MLQDRSALVGAVNAAGSAKNATISLDGSSKWVVAATSHLTKLSDPSGISGTRIYNIVGDGHDVYYAAKDNPSLGGKTYALAGGGELLPD